MSYDCYMNSLSRREEISNLSLPRKRIIFDIAVDEIERLILSSVLGPFYDSAEFAVIAQQRPINGKTNNTKHTKKPPNLPKQKSLFLPFKHSKTGTETHNIVIEKPRRHKSRNPFSRMYSHSPAPPNNNHPPQKTAQLIQGSKSVNLDMSVSKAYDHSRDGMIDLHGMYDDDADDEDDVSDIDDFINNDYMSEDEDDVEPPYSIPQSAHNKSASGKHSTPPIKLVMSIMYMFKIV